MADLIAMAQVLQQKRAALQKLYADHLVGRDPNDGGHLYDFTASQLEEVRQRNEELDRETKAYDFARIAAMEEKNRDELRRLGEVDEALRPFGTDALGQARTKHAKLSDLVVESMEYRTKGRNGRFELNLPEYDVKTLLTTAGTPGFVPDRPRSDVVVPYANPRPVVADLIRQDPTTRDVIKWMEQVTWTNNASTTSESGLKPESALDWDEKEASVRKIATWIPVTEEQVEDVPTFRSLIDNDLALQIRLSEENQLLNGSGNAPDLLGFLNHANLQTQAQGADNNADAIFRGMGKVRRIAFAEPSGVVMNPINWEPIRLQKTVTGGDYVLGPPTIDVEPRLWGKPVILSNYIAGGTALTGDFLLYAHISRRTGIMVAVSDSHDTYFIYDKLAIRALERISLEIKRGSAFCQITGLD